MNTSWSCSPSNIISSWRNVNPSMKLNNHTISIYSRKKFIEQMNCIREPIISVQEQRQARETILPGIKCKSDCTDKCYAEYNVNSLRRGFGQLKNIRDETMELGKPSLVIHSSTLDKNENDIVILTNHVIKELNATEFRKRFAIVHTEKYIYIIGGYIYDHQIPARKKALHDYKYDIQRRKLIPTETLPNGAIGFGLCIDEDLIYAVGGNDVDNKPLSDCYCLTIGNTNETWIKLPDLPAPTSGPGVGVYNDELHCVGGFDVLGNESIAHGEYLILRYPQDKSWRYVSEIDVPRARPLVLIIPDNSMHGRSVYVAGGFNVNPTNRKPFMVPDLHLFNQTTQHWQLLTKIPNLELSHALSFNDNKLHVSETIELPDQLPVTNMLRSFDLQTLLWTNAKEQNSVPNKVLDDRQLKNTKQTTPSSSPLIFSPDVNNTKELKSNRNIQINRSDSAAKIKTSTLKQNSIKLGTSKPREVDQHSFIPNKTIPMNTKYNSMALSPNKMTALSKKQTVGTKQIEKRLKMKRP